MLVAATADAGGASFGLTGLAYGLLLLIAVVYGSIVAGSLVRLWGVDYTFTLDWYTGTDVAGFLSGHRGLQYVWYSLQVALLAAPLGGLLAVIIAYLSERVKVPGRNLMSFVTMLPAVLPGLLASIVRRSTRTSSATSSRTTRFPELSMRHAPPEPSSAPILTIGYP